MKAKFTLLARVPDGQGNYPYVKALNKKNQLLPMAGATAFYLRYSDPQTKKQVTKALGNDPLKAYDVWRNETQILNARELGLVSPQATQLKDRLTLAAAKEKYLNRTRDPKTQAAYTMAVTQFVDGFMPSTENPKRFLDDITREDLMEFRDWLAKQPQPQRRYKNPERTRFNKCLQVAIFIKRECGKRGLFHKSDYQFFKKKVVAHTDEQLAVLYSAATAEERFMLDFYIGTMARNHEAAKARYEDLTGTTLIINGKQHKTRTVEISERLAREIREREKHAKCEFIFTLATDESKPCSKSALYNRLQALRVKSGAKFHTEPHKLRKTGASRRLRAGVLLNVLRVELGHNSLATTQDYLDDVKPKETQAAIAAADFVLTPQLVRTGTAD